MAPEIVQTEWEKGNKATLAALFSQVNFNEDWIGVDVLSCMCLQSVHIAINLAIINPKPSTTCRKISLAD